jgi:hypothetical protein
MAEQILWLVDRRVLLVRVTEPFTSDVEWSAHFGRIHAALQQGITPVHLVIDLTNIVKFLNPAAAKQLAEKMNAVNANAATDQGWTVLITSNTFIRFVGSLFTQWTGGRTRAVETLDDAIAFLVERDALLSQSVFARPDPHREI